MRPPGEAADGEKRERHRHHGRRDFRKKDEQAPVQAGAEAAPVGEGRDQREDRERPRERFGKDRDRDNKKGKFGDREHGGRDRDRERGGRDRDKGGRDKREVGPSHRPFASSAPRERERAIDPNSPFAKLAALKEQLAANRKD